MSERHPAAEALRKALEKAVGESTEAGSKALLRGVLAAAAVDPGAKVLAAAAEALVAALLEEASATGAQLDRMIREPFATGSAGILEALSLPARDAEERRVRDERVHSALDRLEIARTYARDRRDADAQDLIRLFQALGFALLPGGASFAEHHLGDTLREAARMREEAAGIEARLDAPVKEWRPPLPGPAFLRGEGEAPAPRERYEVERPAGPEETVARRRRAEELRSSAVDLECFVSFVRALARSSRS